MAKRKNKKIIVKRNRLKGNTATANRKYKRYSIPYAVFRQKESVVAV